MVLSPVIQAQPKRRLRKSYFPFTGLLRSVEYQGKGACLAENVYERDGQLHKLKGMSALFNRTGVDAIEWLAGYKNGLVYNLLYAVKSGSTYIIESYNLTTGVTTYPILAEANEVAITGTSMTFTAASTAVTGVGTSFTTELAVGDYIYLDGEYADGVRIASITSDTALVLTSAYGGTGGTGNGKLATKHFATDKIYYRQLGDEAYLAESSVGYSYDGTTLMAVANIPASVRYMLIDGNRIAINEIFSGEISTTMTDFTAGAGVQKSGRYSTGGMFNGGIETSAGIILMQDVGGQLHKVIPNNASDNVSAETKLNQFNYTGQGIKNPDQIVMGKDYCYIVNTKGIIEIDPYTGQSRVLTEDGNIGQRWSEYDVSDAVIGYDSQNNRIVCLVKKIGQYDTMIIIDLDSKERPVSIQPSSYIKNIANVNNQLYAGSSIDGTVFKLFDEFSTRGDGTRRFRWILEWDALDGIATENIIKEIRIFADLHAQSSFIANLYKNGSHEPIYSETFTSASFQEPSIGNATIGVSGFYVFALGSRSLDITGDSADAMYKIKHNFNLTTFCLEIIEDSVYDFSIYDIIVEYKTRARLTRQFLQPNTLF